MEQEEYISLGKDCCMAYHLQRLGKKKNTYPFDWLLIKNLDTVYSLIETDFIDFLNPDYLQYKNNVRESFLKNDETGSDNEIENEVSLMRVTNTKYKIHFLHDFESKDELEKVVEKYNRRINRFYEIMRDQNTIKHLFYLSSINETNESVKKLNSLFVLKEFNNFSIQLIYSPITTTSWKREEWSQLIEETIFCKCNGYTQKYK